MSSRDVVKAIEHFHKIKYPPFLKKNLNTCGFESEASLGIICEQSIAEIEQIVNSKKELLEGTIYLKEDGSLHSEPFKFLIGHRLLILSIPKSFSEYKDNKEKNKKLNLKINSPISPEQLKASLLERLQNYKKSNNWKLTLTLDNLKKCVLYKINSQNRAKVQVKCVYCDTQVPCTFNEKWSISNYIKHIASHESSAGNSADPVNNHSVQSSVESRVQPVQRAQKSTSDCVLSTVLR